MGKKVGNYVSRHKTYQKMPHEVDDPFLRSRPTRSVGDTAGVAAEGRAKGKSRRSKTRT